MAAAAAAVMSTPCWRRHAQAGTLATLAMGRMSSFSLPLLTALFRML